MIPGHDQRARAAGAVTDRGTTIGIFCELHVCFGLGPRQDFLLYELSVLARHGVVLETALATLRVARSIRDRDGDHHGQPVFRNQAVQHSEEAPVWPVCTDNERRSGAGYILL